MAETVSHIADSVQGNYRVVVKKVTNGTSSNTADVSTGLTFVQYCIVNPLIGAAMPSIAINSTVAGTSTGGTIGLKSGTSAASYNVIAYGY